MQAVVSLPAAMWKRATATVTKCAMTKVTAVMISLKSVVRK